MEEKILFDSATLEPWNSYTPTFKLEGVTLDELYSDLEEIASKESEESILRLFRSKNHPYFYYFYAEQKHDTWEHKAGYHWSSRASAVNEAFGTKIMEVTIIENFSLYSCAMAADKVAELIPPEYKIVEVERHGELHFEMKDG
jgi:hypothetical protein